MSPPVDPVASDPDLPARVDVVVVGGGIIGVCTALFLAEKGVSVALCEKGRIGAEQSSRNWGWCRTMGRDAAELPLAIESLRLWHGMNARTGRETGFRQAGIAYLCATEDEIAAQRRWLDQAGQYQVEARLVRGAALDALFPGAAIPLAGALLTPGDSRAEPALAAPAIAEAARAAGAAILTGCAVRGLETEAGRVAGVATERGRIACQAVVLAGGAWSRLFCGNHGIDLPQLKILGSVLRTRPLDGPDISAGGPGFAFRKRADGGYTVARRGASEHHLVPDSLRLLPRFLPSLRSEWKELRLRVRGRFLEEWRVPRRWALDQASPFETVRVLDPAPSSSILDDARRSLARAFPGFARMEVAETWGGLMDVTPDAVPVIGAVPGVTGFYLATGFSGHGFGIGPGAGRLMADLVAGDPPVVDAAPFRLERFRSASVRGRS